LGGVPVEFPYEAYECQLAYMRAVIQALDAGQNALLESPTGTGKTLCLLCASLGWRRSHQQRATAARTSWEAQAAPDAPSLANACPRIWYSSRTHSQLKQVIHELKKTTYTTSSVVLGSRQHFCIHSSVSRMSGPKQNAMCQRMRGDNKCPPFVGLRKHGSKVSVNRLDIEEIVSTCKDANVCPFYKCREEAKEAELLFIPYDYIIGKEARESVQVSLRNSILIFDEGHNIERSCEEAASLELRSSDIAKALGEIDDAFDIIEEDRGRCEELVKDMTADIMLSHLTLMKKSFLALEDAICDVRLERDATADRTLAKKPGSYILELLARGSHRGDGITEKDIKRFFQVIKRAVMVLTCGINTGPSSGVYLDKLQSLLLAAFRQEANMLDQNYQVLIYEEAKEAKRASKRKNVDFFSDVGALTRKDGSERPERVLCFWCFSCSVTLKEILQQEVRSIIVTSGTLSPMEATAESFGVPFPVRLENSHVIDTRKQLWGGVLPAGPAGVSFDASFSQRSNPAYAAELGKSVAAVAASAPDGLLLAFQSYSQKDQMLQAWRQSGVLEEIKQRKPLFDEPKGNAELRQTMELYSKALDQPPSPGGVGGAILAAVCRGKLCEGIDFTDRQCRLVMLVGIPYPARNDLRVVMKQKFLDSRGTDGDGRRWYAREAICAVNQTIGRVIRHRGDFGAVLLCDSRYSKDGRLAHLAGGLSSWLRPRMSVLSSFSSALEGCRDFFGLASATLAAPGGAQHAESAPAPAPAADGGAGGGGAEAPPAETVSLASLGAHDSRPRAHSGGAGGPPRPAGPSAGGVPLSALGALWKKRRVGGAAPAAPDALAALAKRAAPVESTAPSAPEISEEPHGRAAAAGRGTRGPAAALPAAAAGDCAGPAVATDGPAAAGGHARHPDRPVARPSAPRRPQLSAEAIGWLRGAEPLLPRMHYERLEVQVSTAQQQSQAVAAAPSDSAAGERLAAALDEVARAVLPEVCFDSPDEERQRGLLVRGVPALLPRLFRPLWKERVDKLLCGRGKPKFAW